MFARLIRRLIRKYVKFDVEVDCGYPLGTLEDDELDVFGYRVSSGCSFFGNTTRDIQFGGSWLLPELEQTILDVIDEVIVDHPELRGNDDFYIGYSIMLPTWAYNLTTWIDDTLLHDRFSTYVAAQNFVDNTFDN